MPRAHRLRSLSLVPVLALGALGDAGSCAPASTPSAPARAGAPTTPADATAEPTPAPLAASPGEPPREPPAPAASPATSPTTNPPTPIPPTQNPPTPIPPTAPSRELEVVARLVEPRSTSHCGIVHWVVVMRYEVIRVVEGTYEGRDLYVAHSCPELSALRCKGVDGERVNYLPGATHHMRLRRGKGSGALVDKFADRSLPRYRSLCAVQLPAAAPQP